VNRTTLFLPKNLHVLLASKRFVFAIVYKHPDSNWRALTNICIKRCFITCW